MVRSEQELLHDYEALLVQAHAEVKSLEAIISGIRARLAQKSNGAEYGASAPRTTRNGNPTLMALVREIMADGRMRNVDGVVAQLDEKGVLSGETHDRQKVNNRLSELVTQDYLVRVGRGTYQLASVVSRASNEEILGAMAYENPP
jgi:hypothetical protein